MYAFTQLYTRIDQTNRISSKLEALEDYFREVKDEDAAWAIFFLSGKRKKRIISTKLLREWIADWTGTPEWLFEESYRYVGDLAETASLLLPNKTTPARETNDSLEEFVQSFLLPLQEVDEEEQKRIIQSVWSSYGRRECFIYHKMLTGGFRVGVQEKTVQKALARVLDLDPALLAHRMMGKWNPTAAWFASLKNPEKAMETSSRPYPFCLAHPVDEKKMPEFLVDVLQLPIQWQIEPKWDGIRAQMIVRQGQIFLWSRGEESVNEMFPELVDAAMALPSGTVLDGEILVWKDMPRPEPFSTLQKRLGRKKVSAKMRADLPIRFLAYDILESGGEDLRPKPTKERRMDLGTMILSLSDDSVIRLSPLFEFSSWDDVARCVAESRNKGTEGILLKRKDAPYEAGRKRGLWWKWKVDPLTIDAVLIYAQAGHGRRSGLYTDYTFAIYAGEELVPIAKAYSGLSDKEIQRLDQWIKKNTVERFGPVRSVPPEHVFELAFDSVRESPRHKAGLALRFPRIIRWREDKSPREINTVEDLRRML